MSKYYIALLSFLSNTALSFQDGQCSVPCLQAGPLAPICLLVVGLGLYVFRPIYGEVVTALPVNGGSYNALLNTTSKPMAALAACLSLLSYIATYVDSIRGSSSHVDLNDSSVYVCFMCCNWGKGVLLLEHRTHD